MTVVASPCFACGLGVDDETGLPGLLAGCGVECRNGAAAWTRRSLQTGNANAGIGSITPVATPAETIINSLSISLTNTECGPMMARYQINIGAPGMLAVSGNDWLLRWYVSLDGGPLTQISRVRLNHQAGGSFGQDWPSTEWSIVLGKNVGQTATLAVAVTFQSILFVAGPGNTVSETGFALNVDMRPEGVL